MKKKIKELMELYHPKKSAVRLGVSIYPEHSSFEADKLYLEQAASLGFSRVFTCLLSVGDDVDKIIEEFTAINKVADDLGMEVIFDVNPLVFDKLGIEGNDLSLFKRMYASGIRLDMGLGIEQDVALTHNEQGLFIEVNASTSIDYILELEAAGAHMDRLITCHNFYPQRYTGLSETLFSQHSKALKDKELLVAAFVTSQEDNTFGPWPISEGLVTLEAHRDLPIDLQARHLIASGLVDDIIVGNAYASKDELEALAALEPEFIELKIVEEERLDALSQKMLYHQYHHIRPDTGDYVYRSTASRFLYGDKEIVADETHEYLKRGDIIVINNQTPHYQGELQLVLKDRKNDGRANVLAHIADAEELVFDHIKPSSFIKFIK